MPCEVNEKGALVKLVNFYNSLIYSLSMDFVNYGVLARMVYSYAIGDNQWE